MLQRHPSYNCKKYEKMKWSKNAAPIIRFALAAHVDYTVDAGNGICYTELITP